MRVWIDEPRHDRTPGAVNHLRIGRQVDCLRCLVCGADKDDPPLVTGDRRLGNRADLSLRAAAPRSRAGARRDQVGVVDQEIREHGSSLVGERRDY
jgi:hypothetical protein